MRRWLVIGVVGVTLAAAGVIAWYELVDRPRLASHGTPAAAVPEVARRLRPYLSTHGVETAPLVAFSSSCGKRSRQGTHCEGYRKYLGCKTFSDNGTFGAGEEARELPPIGPPAGTPKFTDDVRVRAGWNPVWVNAWSMRDAAAAKEFIERMRASARSCAGRSTSDGESGEQDHYDIGADRYAKDGWAGVTVSVDGEAGDEDSVQSPFPPGSYYTYGTVIAARDRMVVRLTWGEREIPWYQPTGTLRRRGAESVTAILGTIGGKAR